VLHVSIWTAKPLNYEDGNNVSKKEILNKVDYNLLQIRWLIECLVKLIIELTYKYEMT